MEFGNDQDAHRMSEWPEELGLSMPLASVASLVRTLDISLHFPLHEFRASNFPMSLQLGSVLTLKTKVCIHYGETFDIDAVQRNFALCVQYLQKVAPNVRDLEINGMYYCASNFRKECLEAYVALVRSLLGNFAKRRLAISESVELDVAFRDYTWNVDEIAYLKFTYVYLGKEFELIRRCSETLQVLKMGQCVVDDGLSGIIVNGITKEYVVYPSMRHLEFLKGGDPTAIKICPAYPGAVPFPNLQTLVWGRVYCFSDDVVFRGSQHSLRSIDTDLTPGMVKQLIANCTFAAENYRNLQRVKVYFFGRYVDYFDLLSVISDMAKYAEVLDFGFSNPHRISCKRVIPRFGALESLKVLNVACVIFMLSDVIELLKLLPQLIELTCVINPMDDLILKMTPSKCLKHLESTYLPLNQSFRKLVVSGLNYDWTEKRTRNAFLLAILCPSFEHLQISSRGQLNRFRKHWNKMLGQRMYRNYKERLQSIHIDI